MLIGFPSEEYFKRKKRIAKLQSGKYKYLIENNFQINQDLYFQGKYNEFYIEIYPTSKWIKKGESLEFDIIQAFYDFDDERFGNSASLKRVDWPPLAVT